MVSRIQFREGQMRDAIADLRRCANQLDALNAEMRTVAKKIDNGGLVGLGGTAMSAAVNNSLFTRVQSLSDRMRAKANFMEKELDQLLAAARELR
jgi:hypothetical protein